MHNSYSTSLNAKKILVTGATGFIGKHLITHLLDADCQIRFKEGEYIWTESSYKYTTGQIVAAGMESGFATRGQWVDEEVKFAVTAFEVL